MSIFNFTFRGILKYRRAAAFLVAMCGGGGAWGV